MVAAAQLIMSLLGVIEDTIVPMTRQSVQLGSPFFGAAILSRSNLSAITVATNNGRVSPLLHGELNCIQKFFIETFPDRSSRPDPRNDTIFLATHEPCSMCLSAIAWAGFSEFYYLFKYEDSRDAGFPDDINIIEEVFQVKANSTEGQMKQHQLYNADNKYFKGRFLGDVLRDVQEEGLRQDLATRMSKLKDVYASLNNTFWEKQH
ncbi:hypothetical protein HIM_06192 [Hirsutella minnesotensis 3608]|uniref:CMP/dCMP-type deaminase domain-containing protein n=1 Tax=Hirsutella minnesotensis 3608 TaxID=1043627 RepID=A0A0F7ZZK5_9HYPO|nr:hypothetical protein HIM_06192 [Hirsutella minnesotensis 3608]